MGMHPSSWPALPLEAWADTCATLHRWTQIVGKVRLAQTPWRNHSWHVPLYVTACGLTTSLIPHGSRAFEITFDFTRHRLLVQVTTGERRVLPLEPQSVATFHAGLMEALTSLGLPVAIHPRPNELEDATPFADDHTHDAYDADAAAHFWQVLVQADRVFQAFQARFVGKSSPVHFFWGSFDLAVTRFSGRPAPPHPGGVLHLPDWVAREAYSHEVSSCGFWPGGGPHPFPLFYSYAYPAPDGFSAASVEPEEAFYSSELGEWVLPYRAVREATDPDALLTTFLESTYNAAADLGGWDRATLDVPSPWPPRG